MLPTTIYKSSLIEKRVNEAKGGFGMYAKRDIKEGALLLMEQQVVSKNPINLIVMLHFYPEFSEGLLPRPLLSPVEDTMKLLNEKLLVNMFKLDDDYTGIGYDSSFFNHSCNTNAVNFFFPGISPSSSFYSPRTIEIYALRDIKKDEEITTNYWYKFGHEEVNQTNNCSIANWVCNCGRPLKERRKTFKKKRAQGVEMSKGYFSTQLFRRYMKENLYNIFQIYMVSKGYILQVPKTKKDSSFYLPEDFQEKGMIPCKMENDSMVPTNYPDDLHEQIITESKGFVKYVRKEYVKKFGFDKYEMDELIEKFRECLREKKLITR